jgi:hypothetical protein
MPFKPNEWISNALFLSHNGVNIYHVYEDSNINEGAFTFHYTNYINDGMAEGYAELSFDVRELKAWVEPPAFSGGDMLRSALGFINPDHIKMVLITAIEAGEITAYAGDGNTDEFTDYAEPEPPKPKVVLHMVDGVVNTVYSNVDVDFVFIDEDDNGDEPVYVSHYRQPVVLIRENIAKEFEYKPGMKESDTDKEIRETIYEALTELNL